MQRKRMMSAMTLAAPTMVAAVPGTQAVDQNGAPDAARLSGKVGVVSSILTD